MLERIDTSVFLFLNSFHSEFWDEVMWVISAKMTWLPLYLGMIILLAYTERRKAILIVPLLIICVTITDQVSVHLFKDVFERLRPCHEPSLDGLVHIVRGKCFGKFGFVSSHASNTFGVAVLSLMILKRSWYTISIISWASVVSYSRIYLGVHYPGDIIGGALLGTLVGLMLYLGYNFLTKRYLTNSWFFTKNK
jgi:undecaprenyl-diphosphatase